MSHLNPAITLVVALVSLTASACGADKPCSTVEDDARPDTYKTVRVVNSTAGPLWLPGYYCGAPGDGTLSRLHMTIDGREAIDHASSCTTCATLMGACWGPADPADHCCEGEGICPETVRIGPGESYDLQWRTYAYPFVELPNNCRDTPCDSKTHCRVGRAVEAGSQIEMRIRAVSGCDSAEPGAPAGSCGECPTGDTCVLQASGACYNLSDGFDLEAKTEFVLALDDSVVVLEFE
jgi:hypothetical protein